MPARGWEMGCPLEPNFQAHAIPVAPELVPAYLGLLALEYERWLRRRRGDYDWAWTRPLLLGWQSKVNRGYLKRPVPGSVDVNRDSIWKWMPLARWWAPPSPPEPYREILGMPNCAMPVMSTWIPRLINSAATLCGQTPTMAVAKGLRPLRARGSARHAHNAKTLMKRSASEGSSAARCWRTKSNNYGEY
jgi:hypothetical protein